MMTRPNLNNTILATANLIYQGQGIGGFYKGFAPCFLRSFPTNGAAILVYEYIMKQNQNVVV